jgi:hypothetical protein
LSTKVERAKNARGCCADPSAARTSRETVRLAKSFTSESYREGPAAFDFAQARKAGHYTRGSG